MYPANEKEKIEQSTEPMTKLQMVWEMARKVT